MLRPLTIVCPEIEGVMRVRLSVAPLALLLMPSIVSLALGNFEVSPDAESLIPVAESFSSLPSSSTSPGLLRSGGAGAGCGSEGDCAGTVCSGGGGAC